MANLPPTVRPASPADAGAIAEIYSRFVEASIVTFEEVPPGAEAMAERMAAAPVAWAVAERDGRIEGYATVSPWKPRSAYRFAVEFGVYVAHGAGWHRAAEPRRVGAVTA
jgi:phosphinothricin acetyltransferase